ncbi:hypothetical protein [uncultured Aureimonas sp.]|uniref:hypothetical protein n=1 Tax=uncultured Aureimonas sp. TaxID=1604662 RepID=UPI0025FB1356|nr:hypothetical protein [uncultured Aureimonas sp.]
MAGAVGGSVAQPIISNRVEQRLADTLDLSAATQAQRSDASKDVAADDRKPADFADYLNQSSITLLSKANEDRTRFDPVAELNRQSVYGMPSEKTVL